MIGTNSIGSEEFTFDVDGGFVGDLTP